jgi:hypothetical protein
MPFIDRALISESIERKELYYVQAKKPAQNYVGIRSAGIGPIPFSRTSIRQE